MTKSQQHKILLVEDDASLSDAFSIILQQEGYFVELAFDGQEAIDKLKTFDADLILLDLLMPVMDGKEFLKKYDNKNGIPILVFSNLDAKDDVKEILDLGADRYMLKAWATPKELVKVIKNML